MKKQFTIMLLLLSNIHFSSAQTTLGGKVTDENDEALIAANVVVTQNGVFKAGTSTDFNGNYSIKLDPGNYEVSVSYVGYSDQKIVGLIVKANQENKLDVQMTAPEECVIICCGPASFYPPLNQIDNTTSGSIIKSEDIYKSPFRDTKDLIINTVGVSSANY